MQGLIHCRWDGGSCIYVERTEWVFGTVLWSARLFPPKTFLLILIFIIVDEDELEAELEALGDELAMEDELKEEEGAVPRYFVLQI
jgi:hypothetical protein